MSFIKTTVALIGVLTVGPSANATNPEYQRCLSTPEPAKHECMTKLREKMESRVFSKDGKIRRPGALSSPYSTGASTWALYLIDIDEYLGVHDSHYWAARALVGRDGSPEDTSGGPSSGVSASSDILWKNPAPIPVEIEVRARTESCDTSPSLWSGSIGARDEGKMSCDNHEGVCYRFRHPANNEDFSEWFGIACKGQAEQLPYGFVDGSKTEQGYWFCFGGESDMRGFHFVTGVFEGSAVQYPTNVEYGKQFRAWIAQQHPEIRPQTLQGGCGLGNTKDQAAASRDDYIRSTSGIPTELVIWSPVAK